LANENSWVPTLGYNSLLDSIIIDRRAQGDSYNGLLWFQPLPSSGGGTSVPEQFSLEPNYPNPFNTSTTIPFFLARPSRVELTVFDMIGRTVKRLVNDALPESSQAYRVLFDAASLASGTYLVRLEAAPLDGSGRAPYVASRKLLLIK
jgi:hypothetical protein